MQRRNFMKLAGAGVTTGMLAGSQAASAAQPLPRQKQPAAPRKRALMKVGTQHGSDDATLGMLAAFGVNNICSTLPSRKFDESWTVDGLVQLRKRVESFGISLDMIPLPLSSKTIAEAENPAIMLGKSPERDKEIAGICQMIRNAAKAGIPALKYNMSILGVVRTEPTLGRGGAKYSTFVYDQADQSQLTEAGRVNLDQYWERIEYFLKRVIPVAEECHVRLACHPNDPGMPPGKGYRGVETALGSVAGIKRFVETVPSPLHGMNFCQGTIAEMLENPREEIYDVIRWFGERKKIFMVHFRNISGKFLNFRETFIDDGDMDMLQSMRVYKEVGFDGMIMPDHVPIAEGDPEKQQAFAYTFGYIKALIAAVDAEG